MATRTTRRVLTLQSIEAAGSQLSIRYNYGKNRFSLSYWYDFDLESLDGMYGKDFMEKVYTHCAAFSIYPLCSFMPDALDLGEYSRWHTAEFEHMWSRTLMGLSGQWRYENDLPHAKPPAFLSKPSPATEPTAIEPLTPPTTLAFFGGGKDSLVMYELLSRAGVPFSLLTFSHTSYGGSAVQQELCDKVLNLLQSDSFKRHHKWCILGDFFDRPVLESVSKHLGITSFITDDLAGALFSALLILLYYQYTSIAMGNERSANFGNLVWECTGEAINHQWLKSKEFGRIFGQYVRRAIVKNFQFFSVLQPLNDAVIFSVAESRPEAAASTHSCNFIQPWCKRCPKCSYVWLMFMAFFPRELVDEMFQGENLLDFRENQIHFVQMLGLGSNKPFECVGDFEEAKLGFELCRRKGVQGKAMEVYKEKVLPTMDENTLTSSVNKQTTVYSSEWDNVPSAILDRLLPILQQAGEDARSKLQAELCS